MERWHPHHRPDDSDLRLQQIADELRALKVPERNVERHLDEMRKIIELRKRQARAKLAQHPIRKRPFRHRARSLSS